jgi:alpha-glucosidase
LKTNPVIYELYPRSFLDTDGSGVGDLKGIINKIPYIHELGVDMIWVCPIYQSPFYDGGYDITDHTAIHPRFGTMYDFEALVQKIHDKDMQIMMDCVFNHTSKDHKWFEKSAANDEHYKDFYVWADPQEDGTAPNNWLSKFGKPAWTWNHHRRQYYMHNFLEQQPNLNLKNPNVQKEIKKILQFWIDKGVDGFRFDAVTSFAFDESLQDNPVADQKTKDSISGSAHNPYVFQSHEHDLHVVDGVENAEMLRNFTGDDKFLIGEVTVNIGSVDVVNMYTGEGKLNAAYTTDLRENCASADNLKAILDKVKDTHNFGWALSNHDFARHANTIGDGSNRDIRFYAMLLGFMPGPWLIYQGEELGLPQPELDKEDVTDPYDLFYWPDSPGREGARVPLPWTEDDSQNYGFTSGKPWLPMAWGKGLSVQAQGNNDNSTLNYYRLLIKTRGDMDMGAMKIEDVKSENGTLIIDYHHPDDGDYRGYFNLGNNDFTFENEINDKDIVFASDNYSEILLSKTALIIKT